MKTAFYISGFLPILLLLLRSPSFIMLIYSFFVGCVFYFDIKKVRQQKVSVNSFYFIFLLISLFIFEFLAWLTNYVQCAVHPQLLHPQLVWDLVLGVFFYSGLALGWIVAFRYSRYSVIDTFIIQGIFGFLIEGVRNNVGLLLQNPFYAFVVFVFLFIVYGSLAGSVFLFVTIQKKPALKPRLYRYGIALISLIVCTVAVSLSAQLVFSQFKLPPFPLPICTNPFF